MNAKDLTDRWIQERVPGATFADIGGVGVGAVNERAIFASAHGASRCVIADIQKAASKDWAAFESKRAEAGNPAIEQMPEVDVRSRPSLMRVGKSDVVHCTGILYHLPSPAEALWNLRSITQRWLITNTVIIPNRVENEAGVIELPDAGVLFVAALTESDRRVMDLYLTRKLSFTTRKIAPNPAGDGKMQWIADGELSCWPWWWLYTAHAFRSLLALCRLRVVDEWVWENHSMQVLCEVI